MCGIIGYIGCRQADTILVDALTSLEYRGYDSAGMAILGDEDIVVRRCKGRVSALKQVVQKEHIPGTMGLGHTRWATHGPPSVENAHPQSSMSGEIVVVHNGIVENFLSLKDALLDEGYRFQSNTDTEVIAHLINKYDRGDLKEAVCSALKRIEGSYSIGVMHLHHPDLIVAARYHSPLIIGIGEGEHFLSSDVAGILSHTRDIVFMRDGQVAEIRRNGVKLFDMQGQALQHSVQRVEWDIEMAQKSGYPHFMLKEIFEQPDALMDTIKTRIAEETGEVFFPELCLPQQDLDESFFQNVNRVVIVSCGTSWHAGLVARRYIETLAKLPTSVEYASEFRYSEPLINENTLVLAISQSGETADTLAAVRESKKYKSKVMSICNVVGSSLAQESDAVLYTHAGPEIGVASTKAFTSQLGVLYLFALFLARVRKTVSNRRVREFIHLLKMIPELMEKVWLSMDEIKAIAYKYYTKTNFIYLGRGYGYAIALEGALKLKEISYIHAEGYHAGEMKHGPIALIDKDMPVVVIALKGRRYDKIVSNIEEVRARSGKVIAIATEGDDLLKNIVDEVIYIPDIHSFFTPILSVLPLQLLSYHIACLRNCNVDQPRNLAKSVTVE